MILHDGDHRDDRVINRDVRGDDRDRDSPLTYIKFIEIL